MQIFLDSGRGAAVCIGAMRRILLAALLALPCLAPAADLPVLYTVEEKPLKTMAIAGTSLTFELFRDPNCMGAAVYTTSILVENVTTIRRLKQLTPKGDTKLPNTDELSVTLPNVTASGNLYLKVTGTGVVPVGGACQAQAAQVVAATCTDTIQNQGETDVDCGGATACPRCTVGEMCVAGSDCQSGSCSTGTCQPSCTDMVKNGTETGIDCGGPNACPRCGTGQMCLAGSDCQNGVCSAGTCQAPSCVDGVKNGSETGVDCGGMNACPRCGTGQMCAGGSDCQSGVCSAGTCQAPSCVDGIKNGTETDVDCGGPNACPRCALTKSCTVGSDCLSNNCSGGMCQ